MKFNIFEVPYMCKENVVIIKSLPQYIAMVLLLKTMATKSFFLGFTIDLI